MPMIEIYTRKNVTKKRYARDWKINKMQYIILFKHTNIIFNVNFIIICSISLRFTQLYTSLKLLCVCTFKN